MNNKLEDVLNGLDSILIHNKVTNIEAVYCLDLLKSKIISNDFGDEDNIFLGDKLEVSFKKIKKEVKE